MTFVKIKNFSKRHQFELHVNVLNKYYLLKFIDALIDHGTFSS